MASRDEWGLTQAQRTFADALFADPERNQTRAAQAAGAKSPAKEGSRWVRLGKVQAYLQHLESRTRQLAEQRLSHAISTQAEVLARMDMRARLRVPDFLTFITDSAGKYQGGWEFNMEALANAPPGLIEGITADKETGAPVVKFTSPHAADVALLDHYRRSGESPNEGIWREILKVVPEEQLTEMYLRLVAAGGEAR